MSELIENTVLLVEAFNDEIRNDLSSKGIDSSGQAANSIRITKTSNSVTSFGIDYLYYLDKGRGPGKFPPPESIKKWVESKPVPVHPFVIGRKIAREGTEIFKDNSKGIELDKKRDDLTNKIKQNAPLWAKNDILKQIRVLNQKIQ